MNLNDKLRLFCSSERTDEEVEALFSRVAAAQGGGVHIGRAVESSLKVAHTGMQKAGQNKIHKDGNAVKFLISRHKPILIELRMQGYGYGKIASILARRKIYNKKTNKAYSRYTVRYALLEIEKEKNEHS